MEFLENIIPLVSVVMIFGIPIAAILTTHQRKMMEMMQKGQQDSSSQMLIHEIQSLRRELETMRNTVNEQSLALDDLRTNRTPDLQSRVEQS